MKQVQLLTLNNSWETQWMEMLHQKTGPLHHNVRFSSRRAPLIQLRNITRTLISDHIQEEII